MMTSKLTEKKTQPQPFVTMSKNDDYKNKQQ